VKLIEEGLIAAKLFTAKVKFSIEFFVKKGYIHG